MLRYKFFHCQDKPVKPVAILDPVPQISISSFSIVSQPPMHPRKVITSKKKFQKSPDSVVNLHIKEKKIGHTVIY